MAFVRDRLFCHEEAAVEEGADLGRETIDRSTAEILGQECGLGRTLICRYQRLGRKGVLTHSPEHNAHSAIHCEGSVFVDLSGHDRQPGCLGAVSLP